MMLKKLFLFLLVLSLCFAVLGGCSSGVSEDAQEAEGASGPPAEPVYLNIATGGSGGAYYIIGSGISKLVEDHWKGAQLNVQTTAATTENIRLVGTEAVQFAIGQPDGAYYGMRGEREFAKDEVYDNVRCVMFGHTSTLQPVVTVKSGINTIADLKGKKVALSAPSSPSMYTSMACLEAYGLNEGDYQPIFMTYAEMVDALKNGSIDCGFVAAAIPNATLLDLTSSIDIKILGMDEGKVAQTLEKYPFYGRGYIKAGSYEGFDEDILQITNPVILITNANVSDDIVYNMLATIVEYTDELATMHPSGSEWDLGDATENFGIPIHPGAEKYYKEKGLM